MAQPITTAEIEAVRIMSNAQVHLYSSRVACAYGTQEHRDFVQAHNLLNTGKLQAMGGR